MVLNDISSSSNPPSISCLFIPLSILDSPESVGYSSLDDVPRDITLRRKLWRALGLDSHAGGDHRYAGSHASSTLPPLSRHGSGGGGCVHSFIPPPTSLPRSRAHQAVRQSAGQFRGDISIVTWNTQALMARDPHRHGAKSRYACKLMRYHDVGLWTETHGTLGECQAWAGPTDCTSWWSPGHARDAGGVGISVRNSLLAKFTRKPKFDIIAPGRAAVLRLRGDHGGLDLLVAYFHTGTQVAEWEAATYKAKYQTQNDPSFPMLRADLRSRIADAVRSEHEALTFIGGDFNYVADAQDRMSMHSGQHTGRRDNREQDHWRTIVETKHSFSELHQPCMTYAADSSRSRLDRIYSNMHVVEQFDRTLRCSALEWVPSRSRHRAVSFRRSSAQALPQAKRILPDHAVRHDDWPRRVLLEYHTRLAKAPDSGALQQLQLFKESMRAAAWNLDHDAPCTASDELDGEDKIGVVMRFIRASETGAAGAISDCILRYPYLKELVQNPYTFDTNPVQRLRLVRLHVVALAREHALHELRRVQEEDGDMSEEQRSRARNRNMQLLKRLTPGKGCMVGAVFDAQGHARTDPQGMAEALRRHWEQVFQTKRTDRDLRALWLRQDKHNRPPEDAAAVPQECVTQEQVLRAIERSNNSAPGPDGIPFRAWRRLATVAAPLLHGALVALASEEAPPSHDEALRCMNESLLVFLPKSSEGTTDDGVEVFKPESTRPLAIANADNRIIASAVRYAIEPQVEQGISDMQRGFLRGRSMIANLVDVDAAMLQCAASDEAPAAVFFDFKAAFPSVSQEFILEVIESLGWPAWIVNYLRCLYAANTCEMSVGGGRFGGFEFGAGVRQGCPLSPLLFAVVADVLLRRIARTFPAALIRAYADDLAVVLPEAYPRAHVLADMFEEYARISGLHIHHGKTVWMPLHLGEAAEIRARLREAAPAWGDLHIARHTKYLGFVVGPERGERTWDKPFEKFSTRALAWSTSGAGMHLTILAYRVYIASLVRFHAQLDNLPEHWDDVERRALLKLFRGPTGWTVPVVLRNLRALGFHMEIPNMRSYASAAQCRVYRFDNVGRGGLHIRDRVHALQAAARRSPYVSRVATWSQWFDTNFITNLYGSWKSLLGADSHFARQGVRAADGRIRAPPQWQRQAVGILHIPDQSGLFVHLRRRLDKWDVPVLPGRRVDRLVLHMKALTNDVPPRVLAAALRTACDGWCSARRFQQERPCPFCGLPAADDIAHFARCPTILDVWRRALALPAAEPTERLTRFLGLGRDSHSERVRAAIGVYAVYATHCAARHGAVADRGAVEAHVRDVLRGSPAAAALLRDAREANASFRHAAELWPI